MLFCVDICFRVYYNVFVRWRVAFCCIGYGNCIYIMDLKDLTTNNEKLRIVQELVPGKQITLAHVIANPDQILYRKLGLNPEVDYSKNAIGIVCMTPAESAIVMADIAIKSSGAEIGFVDRFSGTLIITGTVSQVEASVNAVCEYSKNTLNFTVCPITKT